MADYELIVRGGTVVDGAGVPGRTADVAVRDGTIVEVGKVSASAAKEIDADGALVTPGWVDIHTHYDAQVTWDSHVAPSSWHGVTTAVVGNCGVGFAPVRDEDHERLIELMEGVEDIPGTALHEGLQWGWNSFGEYLDAIESLPHDIDVAAYVPHDPLRLFVMGERGANREDATPEEIAEMARLAQVAVEQGALGFSSDRLATHKTSRGEHTPAYGAAGEECVAIAAAVGKVGGVLHLVSDFDDLDDEFGLLREMVGAAGTRLSFTLTYRYNDEGRRRLDSLLGHIERAQADGLPIIGQVAPRPIGLLYGLQCTLNPFVTNPVFREIEHLSVPEKATAMAAPAFRERLLASLTDQLDFRVGGNRLNTWELMYELTDPPNYEPDPADSLLAQSQRSGRMPAEIAYDILIKDEGQGMIYIPHVNYRDGNLDVVKDMLQHPFTVPGLSDGGAHVGTICDASFPTTLLAYWARDRERGLLEVPYVVQQQCAQTARLVGLKDRGVIAPGMRADINVIDFDRLALRRPEMVQDLPAGGSRLMQRADGYVHTLVRGEVVYNEGRATGALPGRLVRGPQVPLSI